MPCVLTMGYSRWKYCLQGSNIEINDDCHIRYFISNRTVPSKLLLLSIIAMFDEFSKLLWRSFSIGSAPKNSVSRWFTDKNFEVGLGNCWKLCKRVLVWIFLNCSKTESVILETSVSKLFFKYNKTDLRWSGKNFGTPEWIMAPFINFDDSPDSKW